jgi:peroxiredoxin
MESFSICKRKELHFPLLSDFNPKGKVSKLYNAYQEEDGLSKRALYVIDKNGVIAWMLYFSYWYKSRSRRDIKSIRRIIINSFISILGFVD